MDDPLLSAVVMAASLASLGIWLAILARRDRRRPLIDYEPRQPVPWGMPVAMLAVVFTAATLLSPGAPPSSAESPDHVQPGKVSQQLVGLILLQSAIVGGVVFIVAAIYRPSLRDFGLPAFADRLARDIGLGVMACLAAIAPVYGIQTLMLFVFGPSEHPLVEMVTRGEPSMSVVFLASVAAVAVAPIGEEILFRLLLQGWLEKWEDRGFGLRDPTSAAQTAGDTGTEASEGELANGEGRLAHDESANDHSSFDIRHSSCEIRHSTIGLPHGWVPILISSLLFAGAHFGHGPDPIALFVLALVLGYLYQRTHRIIPCIVAHALFNSLAIFVLWRIVFTRGE